MNTSTFADRRNLSRTVTACLIISLLVLGPLAPLSAASPKSSARAGAVSTTAPPVLAPAAAPFVPAISATKTDSFPDPDMDGKAAPGETITYDVNITNSGSDATGVNFTDTIDTNTTLVPGSLKVSPLAFADTYSAAKDTPLSVGAPGVLTNDTGTPTPTAVPIAGGATTQGGNVTLNANGSFLYNPPAGFEGADTFTYTATNGLTPNDTATVTINVDAAPSVVNTTPANGATNQALNTNITVTFSEPVNVTGNWFQISCTTSGVRNVADTVVTGGPTTFTINPNVDFTSSEVCTVTVFAAQVSDQDAIDPPDNMAADFVFSFATIDAAPAVVSTTPTDGATDQTTNTDITITFSEPVNVAGNWFQIVCTSSGTRNVADTVVTGGPSVFTINPNVDFTAGETCTVTVFAAQVTDQDTNDPPDNMAANFVFSFTMDNAPTVNSTTPTNGATQIANNANVSITFSEPVNVAGNWFQISCATSGLRNVADTVVTGGPTTFTINPNADFTNGEVCTVTVFAAQVTDQDTNDPPDNMAANFVFSFTIDLAPSVTLTSPANGANNIAKSANIVITFSENVNATTSSFLIECPTGTGGRAYALTGSGTNVLTLDPTSDLPPGFICTVTIFANQISDTDTGDPPDNLEGGDLAFSFGVKPEAVPDARNATGNIRIQTAGNSNFSVLTNDLGPGLTVTTSDTTSLRGGNVAVAANGTFSYNPPAGYDGSDSFTYTIGNAAGSDVGTVTMTVAGMIWFVNNTAAACTTINGSCGRLTNPLSTLAAFEAANGNATPVVNGNVTSPVAGDHLFIYTGAGTYTGPLTLEANQRVVGQGATTGTLAALSGVTIQPDSDTLPATGGAKPSIGGGGFNVVANDHLYGLAFDDTTSTSINSIANVGTMVIGDVTILNDASNSAGIVLDDGGTSVTTVGTNSINTRSAVALSLTNATNIGAAGLTFSNISAGNNDANPDPVNGLVLNNTGALGGLTVSGGTIRFMTGSGVMLTSTRNINFSNMTIQNSGDDGVTGLNVTNFTLTNSTVSNNGNATTERGLDMTNLLGTSSITGSTITGSAEDNLYVKNGTGTSTLTVNNSTFSNNSTTLGNDGIHFLGADVSGSNNANMSITVTNSVFTNNRGDHFQATTDAVSTATQTIVFQNNDLNGGAVTNLGAGLTLNPGGNATVNFNISNNGTGADPFTGAVVSAITINSSNNSTMSGTINNNVIGNAAVVDSGSSQGDGITVFANNTSDITVAITNNTIRQYSNLAGLNIHVRDGAGDTINATITGNTIATPGTFASNGILAQAGSVAGDTGFLCIDIGGAGALANSIAGSGANGGTDFRVRQRINTTVRLPGYAGANNNDAAVVTFIQGRNNGAETGSATNNVAGGGGGFVGGAACASAFAIALPGINNQQEQFARSSDAAQPTETIQPEKNETRGPIAARQANAEQTKLKEASGSRSLPQTFSHHAKATKRNSSAPSPAYPISDGPAGSSISSVNNSQGGQQLKAMQDKRTRGVVQVKPRVAAPGGETVSVDVGTLLAGKTVRIMFQVTVNTPYLGGDFVSNQGTVSGSNFASVLTDDPAVGGANDPTLTPILTTPNVSVADAQANEPASGSAPMLFTVSLSAPAPAAGSSVHYATADQAPAIGHAVAGVDYTAVPDTVLNFAAGEQFKTVSVSILADANPAEGDETFLLNLSNPTNAVIVDGQAVGTIKEGNAAGTFLISELRTSGPGGAGDDFVELYNNSDTPLTIAASDASGGYGLFKMGADCSATPVLIGTIPNGTVIPARGHYLFVGSAYSLGAYATGDQTLTSDIESDRNVGIFNTATAINLSSVTRLDAVGFGSNTGGNCDLLREGPTLTPLSGSVLEYSFYRDECGKKGNPAMFGVCPTGGMVTDTNNNADDFVYVDTTAAVTLAGQRLGAPGPQNLGSSTLKASSILTLLIDSNIGAPAPPNRVRDLTPMPPNATNGTLSVRRRFVNNTGSPVTNLRFRIVDISSISVPGGIADIRALTSTSVVVNGVTDAATCLASNGVATTPCSVTVQGTTLEQPPNQPMGGAHNSSMGAGTITLGTPLAPGASINLQFLLGVQATGSFKFFVNIEALP